MNINKNLNQIVRARELQKEKSGRIKTSIALFSVFLFGLFAGNIFLENNFSITGFVASGALPTVGGDSGNWGTVLNNYLSQEHTSTGGHGNVTAESLNITDVLILNPQINPSTPSEGSVFYNSSLNSIMVYNGSQWEVPGVRNEIKYFNDTSCPPGWSEMQEAVGRYFVAINTTGTLGATAGTSLNDSENRVVGNHTHGVTDPEHVHPPASQTHYAYNLDSGLADAAGSGNFGTYGVATTTGSATTGITVNNTGNVSGTNAPYIQLLVCVKS